MTGSATMKAFRLLQYGQPGQFCEVPKPIPKEGEILIRMKAAGLCHSDLGMLDSQLGSEPFAANIPPPYTLGHENVGVVEQLGPGVTDLGIGEGIAVRHLLHCSHCWYCLRGIEQHCEEYKRGPVPLTRGSGIDGGLAEFMICPRNQVISIGNADPVLYAPITDAGVTSYRAVSTIKARLTPGTTAIVIGVGGLGTFAIQFLRLQTNATVYCIDVSESRLANGVELGAKRGFLAGSSAVEQILAETSGKGIDGILDFVGSNATMDLSMKISKPQGRIVLVGMDMGTVEVGWSRMATGCEFAISLASNRQDLEEVCALMSQGLLRIDIERYPFEAISQAYAALRDGLLKGRAVITFAQVLHNRVT